MDSKKFDFKFDNEINDIEGYKFFLDNLQVPISICTLEKDPRYIYVNDEMLKLIGVNRNTFNDNDYRASDFVLEEDLNALMNLNIKKTKVGETKLLTYNINTKDGRILHLHDSCKIITYNGKLYCQSIYKDKTIEHNQEEKNRQSGKVIQEVTTSSISDGIISRLCGIIHFDNLETFAPTYANAYAAKTFGYRNEKAFLNSPNKALTYFFTKDKLDIILGSIIRTHTNEQHNIEDNFEISFINDNNELVWLVGYVHEIQGLRNKISYQFLFLDVTNIRRTEQQLRIANDKFKLSCGLANIYLAQYEYASEKISIINGNFLILKQNEDKELYLDLSNIEDKYLPQVKEFFNDVRNKTKEYGIIEYKYKGDIEKWTELQYQIIKDDYRNPLCAMFVGRDITQLVKSRRYFDNENRLRKILLSNSIASFEVDLTANALISKDGQLFDSSLHSLNTFNDIKVFFESIIHPDDFETYKTNVRAVMESNFRDKDITRTFEARILVAHRTYHYAKFRHSIVINPYDNHLHSFVIIHDIDKKKKEELIIFDKANKDSLTELYNRSSFELHSKLIINPLVNSKGKCGFLIVDIDDFKNVNDLHGHIQGDILLRKVASLLKKEFKQPNVVGRLGGDEFVVLLSSIADVDEAIKKADLLCKKIKNLSFDDYEISCSIGICVLGNDSNDYESLYAHADKALYRAKRSGKNCALVYDPVIDRDY